MPKDLKTYNVGKELFDLRKPEYKGMMQYKPVEIYHKEDGSKEDKPCFLFIMRDCSTFLNPKHPVCAQVSLKMLNEAMQELGYEIRPLEKVQPEKPKQ